MDSLPSPFTIEIDGKPIEKVQDSADDKTQAKLGSYAAVFNLKDGKLESGQWLLARNLTEDRSLLPKKVTWFKKNVENEGTIKPVSAKKEGDSYELLFETAGLAVSDKYVYADLLGDTTSKVKVILKDA